MSVWESDGLFWERKCCLSSEKQFPCTSGTLAFFFFFSRAEQELAGSWVHLVYSISGCLSVPTFEDGSRNQICLAVSNK